jgi:hypothetical protein
VQKATVRQGSGGGIPADLSGEPYFGGKPGSGFKKSISRTSRNGPRPSRTRGPGIMRLKDFKNPSLNVRWFVAQDCLALGLKIAPGENQPALPLLADMIGCRTAAPWARVSSQTPRKEPPEKGKKSVASQALQSTRNSPQHFAWCRNRLIYAVKLPAQSSKPRKIQALSAGSLRDFI